MVLSGLLGKAHPGLTQTIGERCKEAESVQPSAEESNPDISLAVFRDEDPE
jgi:hypothetical protein